MPGNPMAQAKQKVDYNTAFLEVLNGLTDAQREAVEYTDGPVLVVAGPGTGKTHMLSARVGRLLLEPDVDVTNILCLTFTDAGTQAMRQRLLKFIGPLANQLSIFTYHAFCNRVIQDNPEYFSDRSLEPVGDLERIEIVREIIDELPAGHLLRPSTSNPYTSEKRLRDLFSKMKRENWTHAYIEAQCKKYLQEIPLRPENIYAKKYSDKKTGITYQAGDVKPGKIAEAEKKVQTLLEGTKLLEVYQNKLKARGRYDYEDMILWVIEQWKAHPEFLLNYQERYQYLVVDEYQDTNGAQNEILDLLMDYWEDAPNLFIVGDDDQSIYEFQGARLENMLEFHDKFKGQDRVVVLKDNFRSPQDILDASKAVIDHNTQRLTNRLPGLDKHLTARNKKVAALPAKPEILRFNTPEQELAALVIEIEQLISKGVSPNEIAVIFPRNNQATALSKLLGLRNIPYTVRTGNNVLAHLLIRQLVNLMQYVVAERKQPYSADNLLFQLLYGPWWDVHPQDLAKTAFYLTHREDVEKDAGLPHGWRATLTEAQILEKIGLYRPEAFIQSIKKLSQLISLSDLLPLHQLTDHLLHDTGLIQWGLKQFGPLEVAQVFSAFKLFLQAEMQRNQELELQDFLRIIGLMKENSLEVKPRQLQGVPNAVVLTTAHSSKGLEFDYVFLFNAGKKDWQAGGGNMNQFSLPDTITHNDPVQEEESRRRLWYVAMTRAKKSLRISFSETDVSGRSIEYAPYIDELTETGLHINNGVVEEQAVVGMALELLQPEDKQHLRLPTADVLNDLLKDFSLSASSLEAYLRCQLGFFYQHLLKIPAGDSMAASFGSAMHAAMEKYFLEMQKHADREFGSQDRLLELFKEEMLRRKPFFDPAHFDRYLNDGLFHLEAYYQTFRPTWITNVRIERGAWKVPVDGVPLNGRLDRIDILEGNQVRVVDYKTGKVKEEFIKPTYTYDESGKGKYWRQLLFYKLLLENNKPALVVKEAVISGLQKDVDGSIPWLVPNITDQDMEDMKILIKDTWNKIQAHEFTQGCGRSDCEWCNLHRDFPETNPFASKKEEDLDDLS